MSVVSTILVLEDEWNDGDFAAYVESFEGTGGPTQTRTGRFSLVEITQEAGGGKAPEAKVFWGAANYLDDDLFRAHLDAYVGPPGDSVMVVVHVGTPGRRFWTWKREPERRNSRIDAANEIVVIGMEVGDEGSRTFEAPGGPTDSVS